MENKEQKHRNQMNINILFGFQRKGYIFLIPILLILGFLIFHTFSHPIQSVNKSSKTLQIYISQIQSAKQMHAPTNLEDIHRALASKYLSTDLINQYECMRSQGQIMNNIRQLMEKKSNGPNSNSHNHTMNLDNLANIQASSISQVNYSYDDSLIKSKFTEEFEQSIITAALNEVKNKCTHDTYETVKQYVQNNKIKEAENIQKRLERMKEEKQDLGSQLVILKLEKSSVDKELQKYRKIANSIEEEKNNIKKRVDYVLKKQNQIYKLQTSFAFKQKINLELKKRYERLRDLTLSNEQKIRQMIEDLDELWSLICHKMDSVDCPNNCWKKDTMKRAKQQLMQERKLLKEESLHIEKEYEIMNIVSNQFKKIFHEPERNNENSQNKQNGSKNNESKSSSSNGGSILAGVDDSVRQKQNKNWRKIDNSIKKQGKQKQRAIKDSAQKELNEQKNEEKKQEKQ